MSVFIRNFQMPEDCDNCRFYNDNYDYPTCDVTGFSRGYNWSPFGQRMSDCPLIEINSVDKTVVRKCDSGFDSKVLAECCRQIKKDVEKLVGVLGVDEDDR